MPVEDLSAYGITWMDDADIESFLSSHHVGVLSLPAAETPVLRPMSYAFDSPDTLYFLYVLSTDSEKERVTGPAEVAQFLVFDTSARYDWQSVLLTGTLQAVADDEREGIQADLDMGWRPEAFEEVSAASNTKLYAFEISEWNGMMQQGPPPGYEPQL